MFSSKTIIFKSDSSEIEFSKYCNENVQTGSNIVVSSMYKSKYCCVKSTISLILVFSVILQSGLSEMKIICHETELSEDSAYA